ncbi:MAG: hypothetical protein Q8L22_06325 [Reyranella sp.]|nr:hypothetical protein [Reyranella sp.]
MTYPLSSLSAPRLPVLLPAPAFGTGEAIFLTPEFSGHEAIAGAVRKAKRNKDLKAFPADSRPPRVVEAANAGKF